MLDKIKWLFTQGQIAKLELKNGDILVVKPPQGKSYSLQKAEAIHKMIKELLEKSGHKNLCITFVDDVNLGIISKKG
jgi:hypothetical protein